MKHRIIDFHTHLGDIFHENKNIAFKRPGIVPHEDGFDPFKDLEESGFTRPLIVPDQKAQNVLIDAGQYGNWERAEIYTTGEMMDRCGVNYVVSRSALLRQAVAAQHINNTSPHNTAAHIFFFTPHISPSPNLFSNNLRCV